jgi:hypothetical protein
MSFNSTLQGIHPLAPQDRSPPVSAPPPGASLATSTSPCDIASRVFAIPPGDRTSPPAVLPLSLTTQLEDLTRAVSLFSSRVMPTPQENPIISAAVSRAISPPPQAKPTATFPHPLMTSPALHSQPMPQPSTTSGRPDPRYMGQPSGAAGSSSVRAAPRVSTTPPGPIQTFPGLKNNCGNDCWASSLLQMMATVPTLQKIADELGSFIARGGDLRGNHLFTELQQLMTDRALHAPISSANSQWFRFAIRDTLEGAGRISAAGTEDAAEALGFILGNYDIKIGTATPLHLDVTRTRHYNPCPDFEDTRTLSPEYIAVHIPQLNEKNDWLERTTDSMIQVPFGSMEGSLRGLTPAQLAERETHLFTQLMWNYFDSPTPDQPLKTCINPETGRLAIYQQANETIQFRDPPQEFILSLKRFVETATKGVNRKIDVKAPLLERFTLPAGYAGADATYEVDSFVCHSGGLGGGHYISYQKIDGNWYCFNDSLAHPADAREVKDALQNSYFQHYKKLAAADPRAFRLPTREEAGSMAVAPQATAAGSALPPPISLTTSGPAVTAAVTTGLPGRAPSVSAQDQALAQMMQLLDEKEILEALKDAIVSGKGALDCYEIFELLPKELSEALIAAVALRYGKPVAVKEIQAQPGFKDEVIYGAQILDKNFSVLFSVLLKYTNGQISTFFGKIFSPEESALINPLIRATGKKDKKLMLAAFNSMNLPLRRKMCQLIYQADVIEKSVEQALRTFFSIETSPLVAGIISEATSKLSSEIESLNSQIT